MSSFPNLIKSAAGFFILSIAVSAYCGEISEAFMPEYVEREAVTVYKKTSELSSNLSSFLLQRFSRDGKVLYNYREQGKGDYDKYKDVTWEIDAEIEEKEGFLYPIYTIRTIKDKDKNTVVEYKKRFDYDKRKIYYTASDAKGDIIKKKTFPIKGKTTDNIVMVYFLKTFVAHRGEKGYRSFYLVSSEPRLYKIDIKVIGRDALELPREKIGAIKLRLIPDMGLLTGLTSALIPPTYVWYTEKSPYVWLQYEGLETGIGSSHIVVKICSLR